MYNKHIKIIFVIAFVLLIILKVLAQNGKFALYKNYIDYLSQIPDSIKSFFYFKTNCPKNFGAITFYDGPNKNTKYILDLLIKMKVPATFFLICNKLDFKNICLYKNPLFEVGMHTFNHMDYRELTKSEIENDIKLCIQKFEKLRLPADYFRPAYGIINLTLVTELRKKRIKGILWNIDSCDWNNYKGDKLIEQVINNLSSGSIILFHEKINVRTLKRIIQEIQTRNYTIVPLKIIVKFKKEYP